MYYKEANNGHKIIYVRFSNDEFIFRTLTRKEYKFIKQLSTNQENCEDMICDAACLYPEDFDFEQCPFAGLNPYVSEIIEELSGFTDIKTITGFYHEAKGTTNLEIQCMDMIKAFIPEYTYEEMEEWSWERLMKTTARAESVAKLKGFDYSLTDKTDEIIQEMDNVSSDNKEFIKELNNKGIDPMTYFSNELIFKKEILDFPLIGGSHWDNEVILNAIRKQIKEKNTRPRSISS
jgi:hypothetical protein